MKIYIFAPTMGDASQFAINNQIEQDRWQWVSRPSDLVGADGSPYVVLDGFWLTPQADALTMLAREMRLTALGVLGKVEAF